MWFYTVKSPWDLCCQEVSPSVHRSVSGVKVNGADPCLSYAQGGLWYSHFFILKIDSVGKGLVLSRGQGKGGVAVKAGEGSGERPAWGGGGGPSVALRGLRGEGASPGVRPFSGAQEWALGVSPWTGPSPPLLWVPPSVRGSRHAFHFTGLLRRWTELEWSLRPVLLVS